MRFDLDDTDLQVQQVAARFSAERLSPKARSIDETGEIPRGLLAELASLGLMGVNVPASEGGSGAGAVAYALAMMEIAQGCAATAVTMAVTNMVAEVLVRFGTDDQRARRLAPILRGDTLGAFALSEPDAGSDPGSLRTEAQRVAGGPSGAGYRLRGSKQWVSHGDQSGTIVVWAKLSGQAAADRQLTCFLVDGSAPGLIVTKKEQKLGLRGSHTCALLLEDVWVPGSDRLGAEDAGFPIAMMALDGGRIGIAAQALGVGEAALEAAVRYSQERHSFGVPISAHQAIQWMLADSRTELDAGRLLTLRAAFTKAKGGTFTQAASMAKLFSSEAAGRVCDRALQIHGGYGYTTDFSVERHLRDARVTRIYEGTSEIQRIVIARTILKHL